MMLTADAEIVECREKKFLAWSVRIPGTLGRLSVRLWRKSSFCARSEIIGEGVIKHYEPLCEAHSSTILMVYP